MDCRTRPRLGLGLGLLVALLASAAPVAAQYKVVGPDGRVTYTDQPPSKAGAERVTTVSQARAGAADPLAGLPTALQPVARRFPVVLYTSSDCAPCERARSLLRQRGVPYAERVAASDADGDLLQRLTGTRTVPTLGVGQQVLRAFQDTQWHETLDLAGYPRDNTLPRGWQPTVRPLSEAAGGSSGTGPRGGAAGVAGASASPQPAAVGATPPAPPLTPPSTPRIRF